MIILFYKMTTAIELLTNICEPYIIYLLEERDSEHIILRKIRDRNWKNKEERERWISIKLICYLKFGSHYTHGFTIHEWIISEIPEIYSEMIQELEKEKYREEMEDLRRMLVIGDSNFETLILNFYSNLILTKTDEELLEYLNMLCPEFCLK